MGILEHRRVVVLALAIALGLGMILIGTRDTSAKPGSPENSFTVIPFRFVSGIMGACQRYSTRR